MECPRSRRAHPRVLETGQRLDKLATTTTGVMHMNTNIAYKLTNQDLTTYEGFQWPTTESGEWVETSGEGPLCGPGWLHFYSHPLLAVLLNPIHASIHIPKLWEAEVGGEKLEGLGLKVGYTKARLIRELPLPKITLTQRIEFGIRCALDVYHKQDFMAWAAAWLCGKDGSDAASDAAARAAARASIAAYAASDGDAVAAAYAAYAAARAALEISTPDYSAAYAAAYAADAARAASINLIQLAELSCGKL